MELDEIQLPVAIQASLQAAPGLTVNDQIDRLYLDLSRRPQANIEPQHLIVPGCYIRVATAPKGTMLISKTHLRDNQFVMTRGVCYSISADGQAKKLSGYNVGVTPAGTRRICYIEEETTWISITPIPVSNMSISEIESELYEEDRLMLSDRAEHRDFFKMARELGLEPEQISAEDRNPLNLVELPEEFAVRVTTGPSGITGTGLYAAIDFHLGDTIVPAVIGDKRTTALRYAKHSPTPNSILKADGEQIDFIAVGTIETGDEITLDYRQSRRVTAARLLLLT